MRQSEVERWATTVLDQVEKGLRVEDDRVELKLKLPLDPAKAARRIAGHANQARAERLLWLIGATDDPAAEKRIVGFDDQQELANWWPAVQSNFEDVAPSPVFVHVSRDEGVVLAIGFVSDRTPYVFKTGNGQFTMEVPWREGTGLRSAFRRDLLRMLIPATARPKVTVLGGNVTVAAGESRQPHRWGGVVNLYVETPSEVILPDHLARATIDSDLGTTTFSCRCVPHRDRRLGEQAGGIVTRDDAQLVVHKTVPIRVLIDYIELDEIPTPGTVQSVDLSIGVADTDGEALSVKVPLRRGRSDKYALFAWDVGEDATGERA